tara:strand:+ start:169 stop:477 length:309 start_codon:yes stop_codon:yes gene_type:complete
MLLNILLAANAMFGVTREPSIIEKFHLDEYEVRHTVRESRGKVNVEFTIDEEGKVGKINVVDTFDIRLNPIVRKAIRKMTFSPAYQNGRPVKVRYSLPIVVK